MMLNHNKCCGTLLVQIEFHVRNRIYHEVFFLVILRLGVSFTFMSTNGLFPSKMVNSIISWNVKLSFVGIICRECGWRNNDSLPTCDDTCVVCLETKCTVAAEGMLLTIANGFLFSIMFFIAFFKFYGTNIVKLKL